MLSMTTTFIVYGGGLLLFAPIATYAIHHVLRIDRYQREFEDRQS